MVPTERENMIFKDDAVFSGGDDLGWPWFISSTGAEFSMDPGTWEHLDRPEDIRITIEVP